MSHKLTPAQIDHMLLVRRTADAMIEQRYVAGAVEHGGLLSDKPAEDILDAAIEEAVDQVVYLLTLKDKLTTS